MERADLLKASPPMFRSPWLDRFTRACIRPFRRSSSSRPSSSCSRSAPAVRRRERDRPGPWWLRRRTLTDSWLHRVVFHVEPEQGLGALPHWMIHGVHHDHPNDPLRLGHAALGLNYSGRGLLPSCSGACSVPPATQTCPPPASWRCYLAYTLRITTSITTGPGPTSAACSASRTRATTSRTTSGASASAPRSDVFGTPPQKARSAMAASVGLLSTSSVTIPPA